MNVALLPLVPKSIRFRGRNFRLLKDRNVYDTEAVVVADTTKDFFKSTLAKKKSQANFTGDLSFVKEANIFLSVQLQTSTRDRILTSAEWKAFYGTGSFRWDVIVPEAVTVDEDTLGSIALGPDVERFTTQNNINEAVAYGRTYVDRRTYLAGENKIVPGGRSIELTATWAEVGGNGLAAPVSMVMCFGGGEYEPAG